MMMINLVILKRLDLDHCEVIKASLAYGSEVADHDSVDSISSPTFLP